MKFYPICRSYGSSKWIITEDDNPNLIHVLVCNRIGNVIAMRLRIALLDPLLLLLDGCMPHNIERTISVLRAVQRDGLKLLELDTQMYIKYKLGY